MTQRARPLFQSIVWAFVAALQVTAARATVVTVPYKGTRQIQDLVDHGAQVVAFTKYGVDVEATGPALDYVLSRPYGAKRHQEPMGAPPGTQVLDANLGLYHTHAETEAALGALGTAYPALADTIRIGRAYGPMFRNITAIKISDNVGTDENEPEVLYLGCHHARELMSVEIPLMFATYLLQNYGTDATVTQYVNTREIYIIPMMNPDGHAFVQANHSGSSNSWWRKNRRNNGGGVFGVDLNRNYSYQWGFDNIGSSPTTSSDVYRGPSAMSEPETRALRDFCAGREFTCWLSYHSYGELLLYPWGYVESFTAEHQIFAALGTELAAGTDFAVGNPALGTIYLTNGGSDDWAYGDIAARNRIFGFTAEVNSAAEGGFAPAEPLIQPTFDLLLNMNLTLLEFADNPSRVIGPQTPNQYAVQAPSNGVNRVSWTANAPADPNPVASYQVEACLNPSLSVDTCTPALTGWVTGGFVYTPSGFSGGGYNAGSANASTHALVMERPVTVSASTDTLRFKINFDLEPSYDYGYVDVSTDGGFIWTTVQGSITTTTDPNGNNRGHGFTGTSAGWIDAIYPLTPYLGQQVTLRIAYVTDGSVLNAGMTIDNVDPLITCESITSVASAVVDTVYDHSVPGAGLWRYRVRAVDAEGQWSVWSNQQEHVVETSTAADTQPHFRTAIGANYPNPFNPSTQIPFVVGGAPGGRALPIKLAVFSVTGARVATLIQEERAPGIYVARWSGRNDAGAPAASGIYFARLVVDGSAPLVRKLVLLK